MNSMNRITEHELFVIFIAEGAAPLASCLPAVSNQLKVDELTEEQKKTVTDIHRKFLRLKQRFAKKGGYQAILDGMSKSELLLKDLVE